MAPAPTSWGALYDPANKGKITVPNNTIQIADAALYLSKTKPSLGITDPYELTKPQFDATIKLLKQQKPLVKTYWGYASDEIKSIKFWKTPVADCGNGKKDCMDYGQWNNAWTEITG